MAAAWRAVWGAQRANPVYGARYGHLTGRENNELTPTQAQTPIAAVILRHLHAVITTGQAWDPVVGTHGNRHRQAPEDATPRGDRRHLARITKAADFDGTFAAVDQLLEQVGRPAALTSAQGGLPLT